MEINDEGNSTTAAVHPLTAPTDKDSSEGKMNNWIELFILIEMFTSSHIHLSVPFSDFVTSYY